LQFDFPDENGKPYKSSGGKMVWNEKLKREIPEGWNVVSLSQYLETYVEKVSPKSINPNDRYAPIEVIPRRKMSFWECTPIENAISGLCRFQRKHILLSNRRVYFHKVCIAAFSGLTRDTVIVLKPTLENILGYAYQLINDDMFIKYAARHSYGSEQPVLSWEAAKSYKVLKPSNRLDATYSEFIVAVIEHILRNEMAIDGLTTLRDSLLPLLMNGQVSVNYDLSSCILSIFSYNRVEQSRMHLMNKKMIDNIVAAMSEVLEVAQQMRLREVLQESFAQVVMSPAESEKRQRQQANEELLQAFIAAKKIEGCSEKTLHYYTSTIEALLNMVQKRIDEYDTNDIRTYLSHYQEKRGSSRVTIDNLRRIFSSFFAWLEDEDYIAKSPVRRIHKVRTESLVKEVLSDEHMEVLRDSCTELRDLAMIDLLASTGVRVGELVQMNCADIDFHERQCVVLGKGNKEREVYFNARTKIHLQRYLESRRDQNPALFVALSSPHNRLTIGGIEARLRQLGKRVGMNKVHPHKFRRTLATMAIDKGMPIEQVQRLLGHVKIDTTLHYAMVNQTNVKMAHRKYIS